MLQSVCCDLFRGSLIKFGAFAFIPIEAHFFGGNYEHHNFCVCGKRRSRKNISFRSVHSNSVGGLPGKRILAVDADPAVGLSTALNMEPTLTLDDIRLKIAESIENGDTSDAIELLSEARFHLQDCITESGQWRQATVFYESALNLALLTAMLICYLHFRQKGYLLPFYMIGYGTIRLFVERLRSDSLYLFPGIRVSQVLSGCLIILGIVILFIIRKRQEVRQ